MKTASNNQHRRTSVDQALPASSDGAGKGPLLAEPHQDIDALITAALARQLRKWPDGSSFGGAPDVVQLLERTDFHGVGMLLAAAIDTVPGVPDALVTALRDRRVHYMFWEDRHRNFVGGMIDALAKAGIRSVVFKGTACAYSVYDSPFERIRGDTDIIIASNDRVRADEILTTAGFRGGLTFARERGASQLTYELEESFGWSHAIDLHWEINNSAFLSQLFSWDELCARSIPLSSFGDAARAPAPVDAILISCFHRLVHLRSPYTVDGAAHCSADRLIWLSDIDRLSKSMTEADWTELVARARDKGLVGACASGLNATRSALGTDMPQDILDRLAEPDRVSAVDKYLYGTRLFRFRQDVAAQSGLWGKAAFIGEHLFPPSEYMHAQFGDGWLPALYLGRVIRGIGKQLGRGGRSSSD